MKPEFGHFLERLDSQPAPGGFSVADAARFATAKFPDATACEVRLLTLEFLAELMDEGHLICEIGGERLRLARSRDKDDVIAIVSSAWPQNSPDAEHIRFSRATAEDCDS